MKVIFISLVCMLINIQVAFSEELWQEQIKEPTRVEKKTFRGITEVEFDHQYGNIVVSESSSPEVTLTIQYFDVKGSAGKAEISTKGKLLSVNTSYEKFRAHSYNNIDLQVVNSCIAQRNRVSENSIYELAGFFDKSASERIDLLPSYYEVHADVRNLILLADNSLDANKKAVESFKTQNIKFTDPKISNSTEDYVYNSHSRIDYIISIPKNTDLSIYLKYGNLKLSYLSGHFTANLSYTDLDASGFSQNPDIKAKYGNLTIKEAPDLDISSAYNQIKVGKANKIDITGSYTDYTIGEVGFLVNKGISSYGNHKIEIARNVDVNVKYSDLTINSLQSSMKVNCSYTNIKLGSIGSQASTINIDGAYSDLSVNLQPSQSIAFDINLKYGDLIISKKYPVKYTLNEEIRDNIRKKGQIGVKNTQTIITVTNKYADVRIR